MAVFMCMFVGSWQVSEAPEGGGLGSSAVGGPGPVILGLGGARSSSVTMSSSSAPSTVRSSVGDGRRPTGAGASSGVGLTGRAGGGAVAGGVLAGSFGEDSIDTDTETISGTLSSFTLAGRSGSGAPRYVGAGRASASGQPGEVSRMCGMREAPAPSRHPSATLPTMAVCVDTSADS